MPQDKAASPREKSVWRVEMLGGLRAVPLVPREGSGESAESVEQFRTHKTALLLVRLALLPHRTHGREELADLLWPDAPVERGRASFTQTLVYLRKALGEPRTGGLLVSNHKTVRIAQANLQTDVAKWETAAKQALSGSSNGQAERLRSALDAYLGPLLPGFYEDWICIERSRLEAVHEALTEKLRSLLSQPAIPTSAQVSLPLLSSETGGIHNAPLVMTRFFGREMESAQARAILCQEPTVRLLTIRGMGGIGKTRFALHLAASLLQSISGPVRFGAAAFVPLSEARTASHLESMLREALLGPGNEATDSEAILRHLGSEAKRLGGRFLLILDNLEQLEEAAGPILVRLLGGVPALTVVATSRQPIGIPGEQEMPLGPLPTLLLPSSQENTEIIGDAVLLFMDRAHLVRPDFTLTPKTAPGIAHLCEVLEGIPLALELAAAWIRVLSPEQIATRLHQRFGLLKRPGTSSVDTSVPKRHHSLHAAIAWSYDLLGPALQRFFVQLSVFQGGWSAEAAQFVTGIKEVSEPLLLLAERSLIIAEMNEHSGEMRYRMLESLREFAHEQVVTMGKESYTALCLRKAQYFEKLAREANTLVATGRGMRPAHALLGSERENLRGLFDWLREQTLVTTTLDSTTIAGIRAVVTTMLEGQWLFPMEELRPFLSLAATATVLLPDEIRAPLHAAVLSQQGTHALYAGDYDAAGHFLHEALRLWDIEGNQEQFFTVQKRLASLAARSGDYDTALSLLLSCLDFARETGNVYLEAAILNNLANEGRDLMQRREWIEQAVTLDREHSPGSDLLACSLNSLGSIAFEQQDWLAAQACLEEAHEIAVRDGAAGMMGITKMSLAGLLLECGETPDRVWKLLGEAEYIFKEKQEPLRVAQVHLLCFQTALRSGDAHRSIAEARAYLRLNRDACLLDAKGLIAAQESLENDLREAGYFLDTVNLLED